MFVRRLVGVTLGAAVLMFGVPAPGSAEQSSNSDPTAKARLTSKAKAGSANAAALSGEANQPAKPWSIEDALPNNSRAVRARAADASRGPLSNLGRVPLRSGAGSFGFETEAKFKAHELPDGRPIPAPPVTKERNTSYFGLSLSVPTGSGLALPAASPPFERP